MNTLNRILAVLFLVGLVAILVVAIVQPLAVIDGIRHGLDYLPGLVAANIYAYWAGAGVLLFLALFLLILELRRPQRLTVKVRQASGGIVELSTESVARSLEYHIGQVPGVITISPAVISRGDSVRVVLSVETDPDADVPTKSEEIVQLARELVEGKLGLKLTRVQVNLRQASYGAALPVGTPRREAKGELPVQGSLQS